jgi:hypothetical protein
MAKRPGRSKLFVLTPEALQQITSFVRVGGHPHVAAEAAGIPKEIFDAWMRPGCPVRRPKGSKANPEYLVLWRQVMQARGQARLRAEIQALNDEPLSWLKFGPGKETPERPGWSGMPRPIVREENTQGNILLSPEMQGLFASILQVLAPFPEARAAVAQALAGAGRRTIPRVIEQRPQPKPPEHEG